MYLVTGGAGFIGSAVVRELVRRGKQVRVIDNFLTGNQQNLADVMDQIELVKRDICEARELAADFEGCEYVIHLAALASVPRSIDDPMTTDRINTEGTLNVLLAARDAKVARVVYAASSAVYGDSTALPKREEIRTEPLSPYAVSKLAGEHYCRVFYKVYGLETVCLRYFNVFGPRQNPDSPYSGVLSRFITALLNRGQPVVYGDGEQSRDFTYVDDVVEANLLACWIPNAAGKTMNVATGKSWTLNQTLDLLKEFTGNSTAPSYQPPRPGDIRYSVADVSLAREILGYTSKVSFADGLKRTVEWFRSEKSRAPQLTPEAAIALVSEAWR